MGIEFTIVYITEAHAQDEWPISSARDSPNGQPILINQHKTHKDRVTAAKAFAKAFDLSKKYQILVDNMENEFMDAYASWPFRYFVLDEGEVRLIGMPDAGPEGDVFTTKPLTDFLEFYDYRYTAFSGSISGGSASSSSRMMHYSSGRRGYTEPVL